MRKTLLIAALATAMTTQAFAGPMDGLELIQIGGALHMHKRCGGTYDDTKVFDYLVQRYPEADPAQIMGYLDAGGIGDEGKTKLRCLLAAKAVKKYQGE